MGILNVRLSAADSWLPAVDLLIYYKNNAGDWWPVAGVMATLGRVTGAALSPRQAPQASSTPAAQGCHAGWWRVEGGRRADALSLHVSDKGLHELDQRLLTLRADLGEGGGLALRRGKDASSRGAGGSPAEVA